MLDRLELEDKIFICLIVLITAGLLIFSFGFKHIPSPVYGGDFYMIRGFTQAILEGNAPWHDPYFKDNYAYYGWLSYLVAAGLVRLTGIGLERMLILLPVFLMSGCLYASYIFGSSLFKSKRYGLLLVLAFFAVRIIEFKISAAMCMLFMLLSLNCLVRLMRGEKNQKYLLGLFMGLTALTHISYFVGLAALVLFSLVMEFLIRFVKNPSLTLLKGLVVDYLPVFLIAIALSLPLVGPWIFKYHLVTLNPSQQYGYQDIDTIGIGWVIKTTYSFFVRTYGVLPFIWGLMIVLGVLFSIMNRKNLEHRLALWWLIGNIMLGAHFLITKPLLGNWIIPGLIWSVVIWISDAVLVVYGFKSLELMLKSVKVSSFVSIGIVFVFLCLITSSTYKNINADRWMNYGKELTTDMQVMFETEEWMLANTNKEDVFLGNDESSFALNALTGRNLVIARRTHASYYVDVDKRYADAIVMLYGNNSDTARRLVQEYGVTYLYLDYFLVNSELITSLRYREYMDENGINYSIADVRLDPASSDSKLFKSIVVPPQEIRLLEWNMTMPVKQFLINGGLHSIFYKVEI